MSTTGLRPGAVVNFTAGVAVSFPVQEVCEPREASVTATTTSVPIGSRASTR
ncbi:hypothetical protein [Microbispora rosea]|uniref:hypothetical protein n=1 Tax=Microbispora rosea TaxID=58117 RepID=UPI001356534D|nr:hypothetical protein [Microbispora rosea]GIH47548.1 hypothetical protein Mro03_27270 [Microbispora rosea subsp. rosea]